jgi:hypothetical protein
LRIIVVCVLYFGKFLPVRAKTRVCFMYLSHRLVSDGWMLRTLWYGTI